MDIVDGLRAFVATAQTGSFTAAAGRLGISNRLVSKYVAELEARLGARLLQRTTRRVGLSPEGEDLLSRAPALIEAFDDMMAGARAGARGLTGMLRISAPVTFGTLHVKDMLARFAARHPGLSIDLRLDDSYVDLAAGGIDLAFRIGAPGQQSLKMRRIGEIGARVVASPGYLAEHGRPRTPEELVGHVCIVDTNRRAPFRWVFHRGGAEVAVRVEGRFMVNSAQVTRDLALAGLGIAYCPDFVLGEAIAQGRLIPLLDDYQGVSAQLSVVYLGGRALPHKVRALIDFAVQELGAIPDGITQPPPPVPG